MAKIVLISLSDRNAYGLRLMSSSLKSNGHECHIIFLKRFVNLTYKNLKIDDDEFAWLSIDKRGRMVRFVDVAYPTDIEIKLLTGLIASINPGMIGFTVNTPLRKHIVKLTRQLKSEFDIPVVWGGFDPTMNPEKCAEHADCVCIGEGDRTILEIASQLDKKGNIREACNLAYMENGKMVFNPMAPLVHNIDELPWRDNAKENKYFIDDNQLTENYGVVNESEDGRYETMSSRGCPYHCTYCCEFSLKEIYSGQKFLRQRTPENLIAELEDAKKQLNLRQIDFEDEVFGIDLNWLKKFVPLYKEKIGLPFQAYIYPTPKIDEILALLKDAGLKHCCLSLQSGSETIQRNVFKRVFSRELFLKAAKLCKQKNITFYTDIITFNPYETEDDLKSTLDVLLDMEGGFSICVNKLFVLPGTQLSKKMTDDRIDIKDNSRERLFNYYARLYWIATSENLAKTVVGTIQKMKLFRKYPWLINPLYIKVITNPKMVARKLRKAIKL